MDESARLAATSDLADLVRMAQDLRAELTPQRGGGLWAIREARQDPLERSLAEAIEADHQIVLVGTIDEAPVGYSVARRERLHDGSLLAVIEDLYVEEPARHVGVGEALMERLVEWCREQGCRGLDGLVLPGNRESKNFFESFGLVARAILVHRALDEP